MIIARMKGGLGNQLFQYATAYSLANRLQQDVAFDVSFYMNQDLHRNTIGLRGYKLCYLNLDYSKTIDKTNLFTRCYKQKYINKTLRIINQRELPCGYNFKYILETRSDIVPEVFTVNSTDIYLDGYYQSPVYFDSFQNELIKQIMPNYKPDGEYLSALHDIQNCNSIAVHVRRGDFLHAQNDSNPNHYLLDERYYSNALRYFTAKIKNPIFYWFSDDVDWVKRNFKVQKNYRFIRLETSHSDIDEMMLMKNCKHIIAANSTFSWWASWLNQDKNAIHVCPSRRYGNLQMIPSDWIKIAVE